GISVNASGGTGKPAAGVNILAAKPLTGSAGILFGADGRIVGDSTFPTEGLALTKGNILLGPGSGILTDGGTINIKTDGRFSNNEVVSSSGRAVTAGDGRDAGDITIVAGSINVDSPLLAIGSDGGNGIDSTSPGQPGSDAGKGGKGGR